MISSALTPLPPVCRAFRWCCTARRALRRRPWLRQRARRECSGNLRVPEDLLRRAAASAICKINIDTDLRLAVTAAIRTLLTERPETFDPRAYLTAGREAVRGWSGIRSAPCWVRPGRHKRSASDPPDAGQGVPAFASPRGRPFFLPPVHASGPPLPVERSASGRRCFRRIPPIMGWKFCPDTGF